MRVNGHITAESWSQERGAMVTERRIGPANLTEGAGRNIVALELRQWRESYAFIRSKRELGKGAVNVIGKSRAGEGFRRTAC